MPGIPNTVDKNRVKQLAETQQLTQQEIAQVVGCGQASVSRTIAELRNDSELAEFRENKADVFESLQKEIIKAVDTDAIKTMISKRGLTDAAILEDKIRLIRGQATSISAVDIRQLIASVSVDNPVDNNEPNDIV